MDRADTAAAGSVERRSPTPFRPCIDIHAGVVKQIVGSTLTDDGAPPATNFTATRGAAEFARAYAAAGLVGGHVIMLGAAPENEAAALAALAAHPGGLQVGGGVNPGNARRFLDAGASHVIVTSFVFVGGTLDRGRLREMCAAVGRDRLVLDLSCRRRAAGAGSQYVVVTDRWQTWTDAVVDRALLAELAEFAAEFLVHGVDVEGMRVGVEDDLVALLGRDSPIAVTYAGGVRDLADLDRVRTLGGGRVDVSVGSALDIFGGDLRFDDVVAWSRRAATETSPRRMPT